MAIDYEILPGRSAENARAALDKAVENGFTEEDVQTFRGGYRIPVEVDDVDPDDDEENEDTFDVDSASVKELDAYIERKNLDVDKGLNKPEKVAAIKAAQESKGE